MNLTLPWAWMKISMSLKRAFVCFNEVLQKLVTLRTHWNELQFVATMYFSVEVLDELVWTSWKSLKRLHSSGFFLAGSFKRAKSRLNDFFVSFDFSFEISCIWDKLSNLLLAQVTQNTLHASNDTESKNKTQHKTKENSDEKQKIIEKRAIKTWVASQ